MDITSIPSSSSPSTVTTADTEWKYEMRRECQEIVDRVMLGPFQVSKDHAKLDSLGITHILCIRDVKEAFSIKPRFPSDFTYLVLDVEDSEAQNLIRLFPQAKAFIDNAVAGGGRVLVHCNGGISLAPAFVIMFVMEHLQLNWEDAVQYVQNRRYCISPNNGFLTQIKEYESIYRANREVQRYGGGSRVVSTSRRKRDDANESDEEMSDMPRRRDAPQPRTLRPPPTIQDVEMS